MTQTDTRTAPTVRKPRGRRVAVIVWLILVVALAVGAAVSFLSYSSQPSDQSVPVTGGTVVVPGPGDWSVYAESDAGSHAYVDGDGRVVTDPSRLHGDDDRYDGLTIAGPWAAVDAVVGPSGSSMPLTPPGLAESYSVNDRVGVLIARFTADRAGVYTLRGHGDGLPPGDRLVVSTRTVGLLVAGIVLSVVLFLVLVGGPVLMALLNLVRNRRRAWPGSWGPGGGSGGGPGRQGPGLRPPGGSGPW